MEERLSGVEQGNAEEGAATAQPGYLLEAMDLVKSFGATKAVRGISFAIPPRQVLGLIGGNGAGKSTLMNLLSGVVKADSGQISIGGEPVDLHDYGPSLAARLGIRFVHQELSLCTNLTVYENFLIERADEFTGRGWRGSLRESVGRSLNEVFPGCRIDPMSVVGELSLADRQMVEIVRAISDPNLKLLILDEPTSSLSAEQVEQLFAYIQIIVGNGKSFVFISHRLREILRICERVLVMRDGEMVWEGSAKGTSGEHLISLMGGVERKTAPARGESGAGAERKELLRIHNYRAGRLSIEELSLYSGEIVGVAGLEGSGQEELLRALFSASARGSSIGCYGKVAFVSGDRAREGVFQHWSIEKNISISRLVSGRILRAIDRVLESALSERWFERLRIVAQSPFVNLMRLSGGNQQKALIARAMAADADIILLNDPTRGVDIETKSELYELFREAAAAGKLLIWYSSEDDEFLQVDRTIVLSSGRLVGELDRNDFTQAKVLELSFSHIDGHGGAEQQTGRGSDARRGILRRLRSGHRTMIALLALLLTVTAMAVANPNTISETGLELLLSSAVPLVFAALAQMFVIAGSDIDLGVGTFVALTNVVTGFILSQHLVLGLAILLCGLCVYGAMGYLIHSRKMPAIVVTLGASFVWYGIALTISKIPGGSSPDWLTAVFNFTIPGVPEPLFISLLAGLAAYLILQRWRYGVVLRAFGNNPRSLHNSGWSAARARMTLYVLAGLFGTFAGLAFTAVATAADPNATGNSYTLLSVAAVVVGGGALLGGIVGPFGVVFGALTLALIGSLLGLLGVNSNLQSGVQGLLLIVILALRLLGRKRAW